MCRLPLLLLVVALASVAHSQRRCGSDVDCPTDGFCDLRTSGRCRCRTGFASWLDTCVPRRALGEPCQVNTQCRAMEEHAVCPEDRGECACRAGYRRAGSRCQFQFLVTEPPPPPSEQDPELERLLGVSREGRRRQLQLHRQSFVRGLAVTGVLVALTLVVFTVAWLVSRRVRQRELQEAAAMPPKYALDSPPPYSVAQSQGALGGSHDDMAAAVAYSQSGVVQ